MSLMSFDTAARMCGVLVRKRGSVLVHRELSRKQSYQASTGKGRE